MSLTASGNGGQDSASHATGRFATTHWSVVLQAGASESSAKRQALEQLCRTYWYPLYAFARRRGASPAEAQDVTQGFFLHLLEGELLGKAQPRAGKFRSFLLASFQYFISSEEARACTQKRGGGRPLIAINFATAESWLASELSTRDAPERLFERSWAMTVLEQALTRLAAVFTEAGRAEVFQQLRPLLEGEKAEGGYAGMAQKLRVSEGAIKWMVYRMRAQYRDLIHAVIAETVDSPAEVEEEVRHLIAVLRG